MSSLCWLKCLILSYNWHFIGAVGVQSSIFMHALSIYTCMNPYSSKSSFPPVNDGSKLFCNSQASKKVNRDTFIHAYKYLN
jgi:hypothetical protein